MKKAISLLILVLFTGTVSLVRAQDVITKKDGSEILAKVLEIGITEIRYKMYDNESGPTYVVLKSEVFMIVFQDGTKKVFNLEPADLTAAPAPAAPQPQPDEAYRKGYVGLTLGPSFPTKQDNMDSGAQVNIVTAGYLFSKNIGIAATILITSYIIENDVSVGVTGFVVGPLLSFAATPSRKVELDVRPFIGTVDRDIDGESTGESGFAFGIGGSIRWNCRSRVSLSGNMDYNNMVVKNEVQKTDMSSIGVTVGVNFRF
ncbi:MAG: porin family protein [Dysgonamonadaceae bacterium]|jgi:hypothetical protein|nr:porin family protein [Dysgonamonadaceae bacterium]